MTKHAICLLSYKGIDYIDKFCEQFQNDPRFNIYIHNFNLPSVDKEKLKNKYSNIKFILKKYITKRWELSLVKAEYFLYETAYKDDNDNKMFHLFSESDYLLCSLDHFYDFFENNNYQNYIDIYNNKHIKLDNCYIVYGSQWKSLNRHSVKELINNKNLIQQLYLDLRITHKHYWALDEHIIQSILYNFAGVKNNIKNNLRYINWKNCLYDHPNTFEYDMIQDEKYEIKQDEVLSNLIIRKIDIMNESSSKFLNYYKNIYGN